MVSVDIALERNPVLIDDLLVLTRGGDRIDELEALDLETVAEQCWLTGDTVDATLRVWTTRTVDADRSRTKQLLENLFRNAVQHAGADVTATVGDLPDGLFVGDDGAGIPPADRDRIFETGYSTTPGGTGLGLSIVREVTEAHGWHVDLEGER